jgi:hypothetical protein
MLIFRPLPAARRVGRVRYRLALAIVKAFADKGVTVRCEPERLYPALGYWRHNAQDVMRWEGQIYVLNGGKWDTRTIESWDSMSDCLKGFGIWPDGLSYEVGAGSQGPGRRYVFETGD